MIAGSSAGVIAATAGQGAAVKTGTAGNSCYNSMLTKDGTGWGALGTGTEGTRVAVSGHVVAAYAYSQPSGNGESPGMYLPRQDVSPGGAWTFAMDTWARGPEPEVGVKMQVDWYTSTDGYLGHDEGPAVPVPSTAAERWTRVAGDFTAPAGAVRANVTAQLMGPAGMTWAATACDYRPTNPPPLSTAAARFGWGTQLSQSDEFNYGSPDTPAVPDQTKWDQAAGADGCMPGHNQHGRRCEANTRVLGGFARLTGQATGDTGWLASKASQRYGRWEVRARSQATGANSSRQYHPVLIAWPTEVAWPQGAEYDFLENSAPGEDCAEGFLHYPNHQPAVQEGVRRCGVDLSSWHNFALEWTPQHLAGYIDGVEWFALSQDCIQCAPGPMHQTIQLDNFDGADMQPAVLEIDWARAYAIPGVTENS